MQQHLYDAIVALGRGMDKARGGGWKASTIGERDGGPTCANGLVSRGFGYPVGVYPAEVLRLKQRWMTEEAARLALRALVLARPLDLVERADYVVSDTEHLARTVAHLEDATLRALELAVVIVNDAHSYGPLGEPLLDEQRVIQWFSDAIDVLAEDLPIPVQPIVPAYEPAFVGAP